MSLKECVLEHYKKENNNSCSEAMLKGCNEYYNMNLPKECFLAASGFSKGMYGGHICGAVSSAAAVISLLTSNGHAHDSEQMRALIATLNKKVNERLKSNKCTELYAMYHTPEERCKMAVGVISEVLEEVLKDVVNK